MTRTFTNSIAALAAIVLAVTSIGTIVTVPPTQAHNIDPTAEFTELA